MVNSNKANVQMIIQALNAAETSIKLAKQLLTQGGAFYESSVSSTKELPGIEGTFDGESMVTKDGRKFRVNPNYASKSVLVYGDTLKMVEENGQQRFKQIMRTKRQNVDGILARKDGKYVAVTADGSYKLLEEAVKFYGGKEGDEVTVVVPQEERNVPYATLEKVHKPEKIPSVEPVEKKPEPVIKKKPVLKVVKKETPVIEKEKVQPKIEPKKPEAVKEESKKVTVEAASAVDDELR